jgi:hypothetical protein
MCRFPLQVPPPAPPVQRPPDEEPPDDEPAGDDSLEQISEEAATVPPEPWYYRFLQVMTCVFLSINVTAVVGGFLCWVLWIISMLAARDGDTGGPGLANLFFLAASLPYLVGLAVWLLVALMTAGWSFLALDAARNLRVLRYTRR